MSRKYQRLVTSVLLTIILGFKIGESARAEEKPVDYGSKGTIGFYGEYIFESSEEQIPPQTEKPNHNRPVLPQTGVKANTGISQLWGLLLLEGLLAIQSQKKERQ